MKTQLKKLTYLYETRVAPFLARYGWWAFLPLVWYFRKNQIKLVWNIASSTGHTSIEVDYFLRLRKLSDSSTKYLWIKKPDEFSTTVMKIYSAHFWKVKPSYILYWLVLPAAIRFEEIRLDCGQSRLKWQLPLERTYPSCDSKADRGAKVQRSIFEPRERYNKLLDYQAFLYQVSKKEGQDLLVQYFQIREQFPEMYPLLNGAFEEQLVDDFLGHTLKPLALIHYKETAANNATAAPTDPETYLPSLKLLIDEGFQLVLVGREKMPSCFLPLPILNYSESSIASYANDIILAKKASLAITGGSGIAYLIECCNTHYLYLNFWHIPRPQYDRKCIMVPTIVKRKNGSFLTLKEQSQLYQSLPDVGPERFPREEYEAKNASTEEILEALKELLSLKKEQSPFTSLQEKYRDIDPAGPLRFSQTRCSHYFLEKHRDLLDNTV